MENPYQTPDAELTAGEVPLQKPKRPLLVWFTQFLLLAIVIFFAFRILGALLLLPKAAPSSGNLPDFLTFILSTLIKLGVAAALFLGLAKAKKWSWYGGIAFAVMLLVVTLYTGANPSQDAEQFSPNELGGAAAAQLITTFLVAIYPVRMYFSKGVRRFLVR